MSTLISFLAEADDAALRLERARRELEAAKQNLDAAKQVYDAVIARSDEMGVPRAKLKRLTEERLASLIDTGLASLPGPSPVASRVNEAKGDRVKKPRARSGANAQTVEDDVTSENDLAFDEETASEMNQ